MSIPFSWQTDAPPGKAWKCPDCVSWATLGGNAGFHAKSHGHGTPILINEPKAKPARVKTPPHKDTQRLKTLVTMLEYNDGSIDGDFAQDLFFARGQTKTELAAFRRALDQYHQSHG